MFKNNAINFIALTAAVCGFSGYANAAGCHPTFSSSATYGKGDTVSATSTVETTTACNCGSQGCPTPTGQTSNCEVTTTTTEKHNYQCVSNDYSAFCSTAGYEPGTGLQEHWSMAWTKESAACTVSPITCSFLPFPFDESEHCFHSSNHPGYRPCHSFAHPGRLVSDRVRLPGRLRLR